MEVSRAFRSELTAAQSRGQVHKFSELEPIPVASFQWSGPASIR